MAMNLGALKWRVRAQIARVGLLGALGVGLGVFAVAFQLSAVSALDVQLGELRVVAERLHRRTQVALKQPVVRRGPAQQLETFYEFFPPATTLSDWLLKIYAAAEQHGVALDAGDYKLVQEKTSRLARYQMMLPVKGSYEQIRGFIAAVLNDVPAVAVDDIALKRETIGSSNLEARLKLTLFLRMENW
ncbi:MAG TPA: GspMb/PilO family protein [Burkholderiales bacterium]|jgi:Tfp pilus assembly protein PilO|nr:GspMb/PilO family protein [Burkholderiales bacterium]